jgi:hypothetical protein
MKKILLFFIAFLIFNSLIAQRFNGSVFAGISANQVDGDTQGGYKKPGFVGGVTVETALSEILGAKIELYYIGKGAKQQIDGVEEFNTSLHYVEMPFLLCLKPIAKGEIDFGPAVSYLISSKLKNYGEIVDGATYDIHNFDFSAMLSIIYFISDKIGVNVKFNYSIVPIKNDPNWFNNNISLCLIYKFK